jgi:hypothetical protein
MSAPPFNHIMFSNKDTGGQLVHSSYCPCRPAWCANCGDARSAPERDCPNPSPGEPYKDCGRGGHMFTLTADPKAPDPIPAPEVHCILKSTDVKLPGWRLRVSYEIEADGEIEIAEEVVHPEQVENPDARHVRRNARMILVEHEARWLHAQIGAWLDGRGHGSHVRES